MIRLLSVLAYSSVVLASNSTNSSQACKTTPYDIDWPSEQQWSTLNASIGGSLLKTSPAASSCYPGNTLMSTVPCELVEANWTLSEFHASLPESIDYPLYANNSCLPPGSQGFDEQRGCSVGALPQYIVNATTEEQIATAMAWASTRNIRIVVKGTGHDMNGRSSGAYSLSIWTHNFNNITFDSAWAVPGSEATADVVVAGSGNNWVQIYTEAELAQKVIVGGGASSVGLGGFIQGGGHGPFSSHYGLAADQIFQVKVVTTNGSILVASDNQNQDLLWAIRGGGAGQYGVVTEYVLKAHPAPTSAALGSLTLSTNGTDNSSIDAAWNSVAVAVQGIPDLMDAGLAGQMSVMRSTKSGSSAVTISQQFFGYNMTASEMSDLISPMLTKMRSQGGNGTLKVSFPEPLEFTNFTSLFHSINPPATTGAAGSGSLMSSRLLNRQQLTQITQPQLISNLKRAMATQDQTGGGYLILGMQGGKGPASVPENMRGALHSSWRTAYVHTIALGASVNASADPQTTLTSAAKWTNENLEKVWHDWAPDMGSYMNEANPYNPNFKKDYYGTSYERLLSIKKTYDPQESLFVLTGVGSDKWDYSLSTGKLCRVA